MSRIGKQPIVIPAGVEVSIDGMTVKVKGPKGELTQDFSDHLEVAIEDGEVNVTRADESADARALHGLTRTLINNMVIGVSEGFQKSLELIGVGYRAALKGKTLELQLGYSHPITVQPEEGLDFEVPSPNKIIVKGINKQRVGQVAAEIRGHRPPEPYKGKGIRYEGEYVRRKLGKAAK